MHLGKKVLNCGFKSGTVSASVKLEKNLFCYLPPKPPKSFSFYCTKKCTFYFTFWGTKLSHSFLMSFSFKKCRWYELFWKLNHSLDKKVYIYCEDTEKKTRRKIYFCYSLFSITSFRKKIFLLAINEFYWMRELSTGTK